MSRCLAAIAATALMCAFTPATADSDFTRATLLSDTAQLQFSEANAPALSADGLYAVFQGVVADVPGIYERNLQTNEVVPVAAAASTINQIPSELSAPDAGAPSVSGDGRYVAFTSTAELAHEPTVDKGCPEVYVRDMHMAPSELGAYKLVPALDGSSEGISFSGTHGCASSLEAIYRIAGAQAAPGVAISEDGLEVAFTILSYSNLDAGEGCHPPETTECTPPSQVAVRDLATKRTTIASVTPSGLPTPGGGAFPSTETFGRTLIPGVGLAGARGDAGFGDEASASTAAISADGSTVAWLGTNVSEQVSKAEAERQPALETVPLGGGEVEPLWRRIAGGPAAATRRLLAGAGLEFVSRITETTDPVTAGSFVGQQAATFVPPVLSADGGTVGVLASATPPSAQPSLARSEVYELTTDAYAVRVTADPAVAPQVIPLTEVPTYAAQPAALADVKDVAISPDGTRVAFDTQRTQFNLPALALVSPPTLYTGAIDTYEANLELGTLQRVTVTYDGAEATGDAGLLSFSHDGRELAFASSATNLFYGDGTAAWEVYLARESDTTEQVAPQTEGPAPAPAPPSPVWMLSATAAAQADGSVVVYAEVPGAGALDVRAEAQLPASTRAAPRRVGRRAAHGKIAAHSRRSRGGGRVRIATRTVAQAAASSPGPAEVPLRLRVAGSYRALLDSRLGLYALLRLTFTAPGQRTLVEQIPVTFRRTIRTGPRQASRGRRGATKNPGKLKAPR